MYSIYITFLSISYMNAFLLLCTLSFLGELVISACSIPFSAPVFGGFLLFLFLVIFENPLSEHAILVMKVFLSFLGLLFIPLVLKMTYSLGAYKADLVLLLLILTIATLAGIIATAGMFIILTKLKHKKIR